MIIDRKLCNIYDPVYTLQKIKKKKIEETFLGNKSKITD